MKKEIMNQVAKMTVAEMRKAASHYGIKNTKKYKRAELEQMMVEAMVKVAEEKAAAEKTAKETEKKATEKSGKRYKAANPKATKEEINAMAAEVIDGLNNATVVADDLFQVNRKVLIVVMKNLKCERWYRTYDKPTMVDKIRAAA